MQPAREIEKVSSYGRFGMLERRKRALPELTTAKTKIFPQHLTARRIPRLSPMREFFESGEADTGIDSEEREGYHWIICQFALRWVKRRTFC